NLFSAIKTFRIEVMKREQDSHVSFRPRVICRWVFDPLFIIHTETTNSGPHQFCMDLQGNSVSHHQCGQVTESGRFLEPSQLTAEINSHEVAYGILPSL